MTDDKISACMEKMGEKMKDPAFKEKIGKMMKDSSCMEKMGEKMKDPAFKKKMSEMMKDCCCCTPTEDKGDVEKGGEGQKA